MSGRFFETGLTDQVAMETAGEGFMLATILFILKIIGLILLGLLGLVLVLLLLILLVPIRYRAEGSLYGAPKGSAKVSWLLHILSLQVRYEKELDVCVKIFGIRLGLFDKKELDQEETDVPKESVVRNAECVPDEGADEKNAEQIRKLQEDEQNAAKRNAAINGSEASEQSARSSRNKPSRNKDRDRTRLADRFEKMRVAIQRICDKLKEINQKKDQLIEQLKKEENQRTFRLVVRQLIAIVKHILPRRMKGRIKFGFDDPFKTGQILTYVSPFYGLYAKHLELIPVFEEQVMEGELNLRGRIRIGTVLVLAVRILFDKNFRRLLRKLQKA